MTTPISVFMITYHRPDTVVKALAALAEADGDFHVFLIDNSAGAIDHILDQYNNNGRFSIYKNDKNIGKGLSYKKWFLELIAQDENEYFLSLDDDAIMPKDFIFKYQKGHEAAAIEFENKEVMVLSPVLTDSDEHDIDYQISQGFLLYHGIAPDFKSDLIIQKTSHLCGAAFLINIKLFIKHGFYGTEQIYGGDDAYVCSICVAHDYGIGIISDFIVCHHSNRGDIEYIKWKGKNLTNSQLRKGHYDQ